MTKQKEREQAAGTQPAGTELMPEPATENAPPAMKGWIERIAKNPETVDPSILYGRRFWVHDEDFEPDPKTGRAGPTFSVKEAGLMFFDKSPDWIRWRSGPARNHPNGYFVLDPDDPEKRQVLEARRTSHAARYYSLADIERMAHALLQNGAIDGEYFTCIIMLVKWRARLSGLDID